MASTSELPVAADIPKTPTVPVPEVVEEAKDVAEAAVPKKNPIVQLKDTIMAALAVAGSNVMKLKDGAMSKFTATKDKTETRTSEMKDVASEKTGIMKEGAEGAATAIKDTVEKLKA